MISGAIMCEETLFQKSSTGTTFPELLLKQGVRSGIKVDLGTAALLGSPEETYTLGLDDLPARCAKYVECAPSCAVPPHPPPCQQPDPPPISSQNYPLSRRTSRLVTFFVVFVQVCGRFCRNRQCCPPHARTLLLVHTAAHRQTWPPGLQGPCRALMEATV